MTDRNVQLGPGTHNSAFPAEWRTTTRGGPMTVTQLRDALDKAWRELEADALASDGPIRDSDVKDAIKRNRAHIEAAAQQEARAGLVEACGHRRISYVEVCCVDCNRVLDRRTLGDRIPALAAFTPPATEGCECVCHRPEPAYRCDLCESQHPATGCRHAWNEETAKCDRCGEPYPFAPATEATR